MTSIKAILRRTPIKALVDYIRYRRSAFARFEDHIPAATRRVSNKVISWADDRADKQDERNVPRLFETSPDPVVRESFRLRKKLSREFHQRHEASPLRVLVHVPDQHRSPGGYSLFRNLIDSADRLGYRVRALAWSEDTEDVLVQFKPNVLLTSDSQKWLGTIDWTAVEYYRRSQHLLLGLTASLEEEYNTPLSDRLRWAKKHGVSFYYVYDTPAYLASRKEAYAPFYDAGYAIYSYEYTVDPEKHYPVPNVERDIPYVFLGSGYRHRSKEQRYVEYFSAPLSKVPGVLYGPGWRGIKYQGIRPERDRYVYARCKLGLNLSIARQLKWPSVLNERTYMLAACGIPQLTDRPLFLSERFSDDALYVADSPEEYAELFSYAIDHPEESQERALKSLRLVLTSHTNYHRCEEFFTDLEKELDT